MEKKYEFTGETTLEGGAVLRRIRAVRDFGPVAAGDVGGWVETEDNLSHDGDAWVGGNARVIGSAWVDEDSRVGGNARVGGDAWVIGNARVDGSARIDGSARVGNGALVRNASGILVTRLDDSDGNYATFYRTGTGVSVISDRFEGTVDEFSAWAKETHGDDPYGRACQLAAAAAKRQMLGGDGDD